MNLPRGLLDLEEKAPELGEARCAELVRPGGLDLADRLADHAGRRDAALREDDLLGALAIVTPGILGGDYFREVAAVIDAAAGGPPDLVAIGEVMRRHGLTPSPDRSPPCS